MPTIDDAKLLEEIQRMRAIIRSRSNLDLRLTWAEDWQALNDYMMPREIYFMDFFKSFWRRLTRRLRA